MTRRLASAASSLWRHLPEVPMILAGVLGLMVLVGFASSRDKLPAEAGLVLVFAWLYVGSMVFTYQTERRIASLKPQLAQARKAPSDAPPGQ